jgi:predicted nucleic acid-binding protein
MYEALLDTSVLIDLEVVDLGEYTGTDTVASAISIAELAYGLDVADPVERLTRTERFEAILEEFVVLPFNLETAKLYGTLASLVRQSGRNPRPRRMALQIAATAVAHRIPLLTRNPDDFTSVKRMLQVVAI